MVLDSNQGRPPLTYVQGRQEIVPGLERALSGMHAGEEKQVTVPPADGYGDVDPAAVAEVPKDLVPADARVAGTELMARGPQGASRLVRVKEVREGTVVLDLNHPLAGKTLSSRSRWWASSRPGRSDDATARVAARRAGVRHAPPGEPPAGAGGDRGRQPGSSS